jgi:hypothetical protein
MAKHAARASEFKRKQRSVSRRKEHENNFLSRKTFFIAEIVIIYCDDMFLTDFKPDMAKIKPFVLTMPDNHFWALGACIGKAWHAGKKFRKPSKDLA